MPHRGTLVRMSTAILLVAVLPASGCGQVSVGEQAPAEWSSTSAAQSEPASAEQSEPRTEHGTDGAPAPGAEPPLVPGPGAPAGCADLVGPLHRLVSGEGGTAGSDTAATAEEVRRLADGTADNALSAVARRISGLSAQPTVDLVALDTEWKQITQICVLD